MIIRGSPTVFMLLSNMMLTFLNSFIQNRSCGVFKPNKSFIKVYTPFMGDPAARYAGSEICEMVGLRSGVVYPLLNALEDKKWLSAEWEVIPPGARRTRPQKKYYQATAKGVKQAKQVITVEYPHLSAALVST